jgi:hypothetical protein
MELGGHLVVGAGDLPAIGLFGAPGASCTGQNQRSDDEKP